jgi:hypothetical protein
VERTMWSDEGETHTARRDIMPAESSNTVILIPDTRVATREPRLCLFRFW